MSDYPWKERVCKWFKLNGTTVREPIKWTNVHIIGKRDKDWHGFNYMFSDGIIELEFDCAAGKEIIESEYDAKGSDGEVFFQHGYTYSGVDNILFDGRLNLNTFKRMPGKVSASVEKKDFNAQFISRFDTKVSLGSQETISGDVIAPPVPVQFTFHPKEIIRKFKLVTNFPETALNSQSDRFAVANYIHPNTTTPELSEIEDHFGYMLNVSALNPVSVDLYNWRAKFAGNYQFDIKYTMEVQMSAIFGNNSYSISNVFNVNGVELQVGSAYTGGINQDGAISITVQYSAQLPYDLNEGDRVFFYTKVVFGNNNGSNAVVVNAYQTSVNINVTALEKSLPTPGKGWWIFNAIDHVIKSITDNAASLKSSFLTNALYTVTNGKQIRRFEVEKYPLNIALKELMNSIKAIFALGYGFENDGLERVVIERMTYFFQDRLIISIDDLKEYREEAAKDILYNQVDIGYNKYIEEGYNTLDEFNTRHEYQTPVQTNKLKLTIKSDLIASGYTIENVRRKQFSETSGDSSAYDDDGFIIAMRDEGGGVYAPEKNEPFEIVQNVISPESSYNLRISPRRMLVNWSSLLAGFLHYKQPVEVIKNTYAAQNGELLTSFKSTEPNVVGDINKRLWKEDEDYPLGSLFSDAERIFSPEWIYFKTRLTPDKANLINESLAGKRDASTNYGYVQVRSYNGNYVSGFPYETEYNFATEEFSCKMLRKFDGVTIIETYFLIDNDNEKITDSDGSAIIYEIPVGVTYYVTDQDDNRLVDDDGDLIISQ